MFQWARKKRFTAQYRKPSKNLQSRAIHYVVFYGNPRKLRVFQIPLTILIGIERREALKDSTSGLLLCFFLLSFMSERAKKKKAKFLPRRLFFSLVYAKKSKYTRKRRKNVNGLLYIHKPRKKKHKSLLLKVIESYFGINHFRISKIFINFSHWHGSAEIFVGFLYDSPENISLFLEVNSAESF